MIKMRPVLVAWNTRDDHVDTASCGPRTGRSAHYEARCREPLQFCWRAAPSGSGLCRGRTKNMKRHCTRS